MLEILEIRYLQDLAKYGYSYDHVQVEATKHLQSVFDRLTKTKSSVLPSWFTKKPESVKGLYLWGGVGRGKTWLMDSFYECLPFNNKLRMHFHHFMKHVHEELHMLSGHKNPLKKVASNMAQRAKTICFDEFFVEDIADAMILARLLKYLFEYGVTLVATSNVIPEDLYKNGLQRARFLSAIALLNKYTTVFNVDGDTDYRLRILENANTYHFPLNSKSHQQLQQAFTALSNHLSPVTCNTPIMIAGRKIDCITKSGGVGWFSFAALCCGPRSQNDYIHLARLFHTVIMEGLPQLSLGRDDQTRRFISLTDEFYDRNVALIISAETDINTIYCGRQLAFEFKRTVSRLQEMQSKDYLTRTHMND
ncbi:MAG: cell division protein ZapE [Candidatus Endonucleobacter bathymodioli]|uniref:Cell division protein ZapE n=1 Tax=Candidatus Endonucleibacter bathymodioli TaxID=539814 RepID=A0AA90SCK2_9GAMM|nr:cell division protein ZapE [Candidatus Endonucleobacter bathymodioli]